MKYDFILKLENLDTEQEFMLQSLGLDRVFDAHLGLHRHPNPLTLEDKVSRYFSQLDASMKTDLVKIYKQDFLLFDYDPNIYLQ